MAAVQRPAAASLVREPPRPGPPAAARLALGPAARLALSRASRLAPLRVPASAQARVPAVVRPQRLAAPSSRAAAGRPCWDRLGAEASATRRRQPGLARAASRPQRYGPARPVST